MKTVAVLLFASALSLTTACTDEATYPTGAAGLRPGYKPELGSSLGNQDNLPDDQADIDDSFDDSTTTSSADPRTTTDGRVRDWAEEIVLNGEAVTELHLGSRVFLVDDDGQVVDRSAP